MIYQETSDQVHMSEFPADVVVTVTGTPPLMQSITDEMAKSNAPILALAGHSLMIVALLVSFNHVKWSLAHTHCLPGHILDLRSYGISAYPIYNGLHVCLSGTDWHRHRLRHTVPQ